ncbi:MAG: hypothetical protein KGY99_00635 [Phycisphaerae bacterium]|nr:hypothetical protein [Phycisphaerae bacterium]
MTKRELIDAINGINNTARPDFLADFNDDELSDYLEHLRQAGAPRPSVQPERYQRYFENCPVADAPADDHMAPQLATAGAATASRRWLF